MVKRVKVLRLGKIRFLFAILGIGFIIVALVGGHFLNWRAKAVVLKTDKTNVFVTSNNELKITPQAFTLHDVNVEYYTEKFPKKIDVSILMEENGNWKTVNLQVNKPYKLSFGKDLFLIKYDNNQKEDSQFCVLELVNDPLQYFFLMGLILIMISALLLILNN